MERTLLKRMIVAAALFFVSACSQQPQIVAIEGETMGTTYRVVVVTRGGMLDQRSLNGAVTSVFSDVNMLFSNWDPESEISRLNAAEVGQPFSVSKDMLELLKTADEVHVGSDGLFDLTLGPLVKLWGFFTPEPNAAIPSDEEIAAALQKVGQRTHITRDDDQRTVTRLQDGTSLFVSAIAKGEGIDLVSRKLTSMGLDNFMVEVGGDLFAIGPGPTGEGWRIGIEEPTAGGRKLERIVAINGYGMATSGDYRNYFEEDGVRYSHILNARTGRPVLHSTASVTVLAENAALADAWATALLALGSERGLVVAQEQNLAAFFIDRIDTDSDDPFQGVETATFTALSQSE